MRTVSKAILFAIGAAAIFVQPDADAAINAADPVDWHVSTNGASVSEFARPFGHLALSSDGAGSFSNRFQGEIDALAAWSKSPDLFANLPTGDEKQSKADPFNAASEGEQKAEVVPLPKPRPHQLAVINQHEIVARPPVSRIALGRPVLAPLAHVRFCQAYPADCQAQKVVFRGGPIDLTPERLEELKAVNASVNRAIHPQEMHETVADEKWLILPKYGDCNDYAVSKRHELLAKGWPARALLLAEVVTSWGEHHLVLVVRTNEGDLVADNLNPRIRLWSATPYEWVRIQNPQNPSYWASARRAPSV